jgi:hypothetical protein
MLVSQLPVQNILVTELYRYEDDNHERCALLLLKYRALRM